MNSTFGSGRGGRLGDSMSHETQTDDAQFVEAGANGSRGRELMAGELETRFGAIAEGPPGEGDR